MLVPSSDGGVSFVIPVYNKRQFLPQVIAGLKAQRGDFAREFIFVDDGSTDGSGDELRRLVGGLGDTHILVETNSGPSVATNRGLENARYPLIKLVDGDDVLLPDATASLRAALLRHPDCVLAYGTAGAYASVEEALARLADALAPPTSDGTDRVVNALPGLLRGCHLGPSNCLALAAAMREVGGCDERIFVQDYSLFLRLAARGKFVATEIPTVINPSTAEGRLNDGGPQVLHDINLALVYFLAEANLPSPLTAMAARRAVTRAWLWAKRREGAPALSYWSLLRLAAYLPIPGLTPILLRCSCAAFTQNRSVRTSRARDRTFSVQPSDRSTSR